jgi:hypothetical protein
LVDRRSRAILGQLGPLVVLNLVFGLFSGTIDNAAHIGGLLAGIWLGALMMPSGVPTTASLDPSSAGPASPGWRTSRLLRGAGVLALIVVLLVGLTIGTRARGGTGPDGLLAYSSPKTTWGPGAPAAPPTGSSVTIVAAAA